MKMMVMMRRICPLPRGSYLPLPWEGQPGKHDDDDEDDGDDEEDDDEDN